MMQPRNFASLLFALAAAAAVPTPGAADPIADFYAGKEIKE